MLKKYLKEAFSASRKFFDFTNSTNDGAFEEWYEKHKAEYENIQCMRVRDIEELKGRKLSVVKLDSNFHIYVHGDKSKIETCEDEQGKFVKLRYDVAHW